MTNPWRASTAFGSSPDDAIDFPGTIKTTRELILEEKTASGQMDGIDSAYDDSDLKTILWAIFTTDRRVHMKTRLYAIDTLPEAVRNVVPYRLHYRLQRLMDKCGPTHLDSRWLIQFPHTFDDLRGTLSDVAAKGDYITMLRVACSKKHKEIRSQAVRELPRAVAIGMKESYTSFLAKQRTRRERAFDAVRKRLKRKR